MNMGILGLLFIIIISYDDESSEVPVVGGRAGTSVSFC